MHNQEPWNYSILKSLTYNSSVSLAPRMLSQRGFSLDLLPHWLNAGFQSILEVARRGARSSGARARSRRIPYKGPLEDMYRFPSLIIGICILYFFSKLAAMRPPILGVLKKGELRGVRSPFTQKIPFCHHTYEYASPCIGFPAGIASFPFYSREWARHVCFLISGMSILFTHEDISLPT